MTTGTDPLLLTGGQVLLYARDPARLAAFYGGLGFSERFNRQGEDWTIVEVSLGGFSLGLLSRDYQGKLSGVLPQDGPPQGEVLLWCQDAAAAYHLALSLGAEDIRAPFDLDGRMTVSQVSDPEGNRVKFISPLLAEDLRK